MSKKRVAINGFGRIGRAAFRRLVKNHPHLEVVAINDLSDAKTLVHLLRYDSVYGMYEKVVKERDGEIMVDGVKEGAQVKVFAERDPANLPWKELEVDVVLECTGLFRDFEGASKHIQAGAKRVIISAPSKDPEKIPSYVLGVNAYKFSADDTVIDMGSCTTNCLAPIAKAVHENYGIVKGVITTVHSYTSDQRLLDASHRDLRRARAAALSMIPTTTGAAQAIGRVMPELQGKLDGIAVRVPTPTVSLLDMVLYLEKETTREDLNYTLKKESQKAEYRGVLGVEDAQLVSSDYVGNYYSAVVDSELTRVNGDMAKIVAWYDNEWAYACRLAEMADFVLNK